MGGSSAYFCNEAGDDIDEVVWRHTDDCSGPPSYTDYGTCTGNNNNCISHCSSGQTCSVGKTEIYGYNDTTCDREDEIQSSNYLVLDHCYPASGSIGGQIGTSYLYTCDENGALSMDMFASSEDCTGQATTTDLSTCSDRYGNGFLGVCGDWIVSRTPDLQTTGTSFTDEYDPGCRALRTGHSSTPIDKCLLQNTGSIIYECSVYGTAVASRYSTSDCTDEPIESYDPCSQWSVSTGSCAAYCANTAMCSNYATVSGFNGSEICDGDVTDIQYYLLDSCGPLNGTVDMSAIITCDGADLSLTQYASADCLVGTEMNVTSFNINECDSSEEYSNSYLCPSSQPTVTVVTSTGTTDMDDTQTSDDVDPTVDGSSAFLVSKAMAIILSIIGSVYLV